jgi:hypothetical protein
LERGIPTVKQKRQASAAFLGVTAFLTKVVGMCCIPTTILTDFSVVQATFRPRDGRATEIGLLGASRIKCDEVSPMKQAAAAGAAA